MLTQEGFYLDRRFMLLKDHEETPAKLENMAVSTFARMCLFHTSIQGDTLIVTYRAPGSEAEDDSPGDSIEVPLDPESVAGLPQIPIDMHGSPTTGFDMGEEYGMWFSARFGFKVVLAFWGGNARAVLGNLPGRPTKQGPRRKNAITKWLGWVPVMGPALALSRDDDDDERIAFSDVAPYLVISETSVADVSARLPDGVDMDLTKFRANMVLSGAPTPFAEDYWGELAVGGGAGGARIILTGNCGRCLSLNVDYRTGAHGTGRQEQVLRLLQRDRRVDPGTKYSPVFGRYGFVARGDEGRVLRVGDEVALTRRNEARTTFCAWISPPGVMDGAALTCRRLARPFHLIATGMRVSMPL